MSWYACTCGCTSTSWERDPACVLARPLSERAEWGGYEASTLGLDHHGDGHGEACRQAGALKAAGGGRSFAQWIDEVLEHRAGGPAGKGLAGRVEALEAREQEREAKIDRLMHAVREMTGK